MYAFVSLVANLEELLIVICFSPNMGLILEKTALEKDKAFTKHKSSQCHIKKKSKGLVEMTRREATGAATTDLLGPTFKKKKKKKGIT